jgi:hypothetical protein
MISHNICLSIIFITSLLRPRKLAHKCLVWAPVTLPLTNRRGGTGTDLRHICGGELLYNPSLNARQTSLQIENLQAVHNAVTMLAMNVYVAYMLKESAQASNKITSQHIHRKHCPSQQVDILYCYDLNYS